MAYARFSYCDVYVFLSVSGHLECCMCRLGPDLLAPNTSEMLAHLQRHREAGHDVPEEVLEELRDKEEYINARIAEMRAEQAT